MEILHLALCVVGLTSKMEDTPPSIFHRQPIRTNDWISCVIEPGAPNDRLLSNAFERCITAIWSTFKAL